MLAVENYVDLINVLNKPLGKLNNNQLEWCISIVLNFNSKDQKNNENLQKILINLCKHSLYTKKWKILEKSLKQFIYINDNKENIYFCEGLIYSALYITKTNFNKNDNPLPEFKDVIKIKDIIFGLDNILKAAELSYKNHWFDMLYKCSQAMWCIIEPWFILHYSFSKVFVSYIFIICNLVEKANISNYEWDIFLYFKLSKALYISSTISKDIKYIKAISIASKNNISINTNINKSLKNIVNNVRNTIKAGKTQSQNQSASSNINLNNKNNEKSIFYGIVTLHPELYEIILSLLKKTTQISQNFVEDSIK
ncbi:hypothetical protein BCR36DRAFT_340130, partial [Piromyces finnis]